MASGYIDPRQKGEALWPAKYPLSELTKRKALSGQYDWEALYQQHPIPSGGGLFKEIWFANKYVDVAPAIMRMVRGWDTAATEDGGDYTCGCKIGEEIVESVDEKGRPVFSPSGRFYILDMKRKQLGPAGVDALMKITAEQDGRAIAQREEKEGGASGKTVIEARTKMLVGYDHTGVEVTGNKVTRSKPFRAQCEAGNVYILRDRGCGGLKDTGWNLDYMTELCGFPTAKNDDQVDASTCAFNAVLLEPMPVRRGLTW